MDTRRFAVWTLAAALFATLVAASTFAQPAAGGFGGRGGRGGGAGGPGGGGGFGGFGANSLPVRARTAVLNSPKMDKFYGVFVEQAAKIDGEISKFADGILLNLAARKIGTAQTRDAAAKAIDAGWAEPKRRIQIMQAAVLARDSSRAPQIVEAMNDADKDVTQAAQSAVQQLGIDPEKIRADAQLPRLGTMPVPEVLDAVVKTVGEVRRGQQLFTELSCVACHTTSAAEAQKGPFLGTIANTYKRRELAEAILLPNKTIAQGFVANHFELKDGTELDGFVVREAADVVTMRTITAQEYKLPVAQIIRREKQEKSLMPEGLAANLTVQDLASLLDYLESLARP